MAPTVPRGKGMRCLKTTRRDASIGELAAEGYDEQRTSTRYERWKWSRELRVLARALRADGVGQRILDVPVGTGRVVPTLQALGARVVAADISLDMLHQARGRNPTLSQFILCEGENLPLKDGCVDAAVSVRLFQHLPRSAAVRIAAELRRVSPRRVYVQVPIEQPWSPVVRALGGLVLRRTLRHSRTLPRPCLSYYPLALPAPCSRRLACDRYAPCGCPRRSVSFDCSSWSPDVKLPSEHERARDPPCSRAYASLPGAPSGR